MDFTGERFIPNNGENELAIEHFQRYEFAKEITKNKVVLDAACGEGYGTNILSKEASKVYGIDISKESIEHAKKKYESKNIEFTEASIEKLPFEDNSFDVIVSFETIEHVNINIQKKFLSEVKRVLKKDGIFLVSTPNKKVYSDIFKYKNEFHEKEFYKEEYIKFLKEYFNYVELYSQYFEVSSNIENINSKLAIKESEFLEDNAKYFVAVCNDKGKQHNIKSSVYVDKNNRYNQVMNRILNLQDEVEEKNNHIFKLNSELSNCDKEIKRLNTHIEEISLWAKGLDSNKDRYEKEKKIIKNKLSYIKMR
ncbi:class I SAM-dependent methyltransferase [Romboutsia maritimum]|uniref:Class I SAM-dependent methyltransferase n=1 Tax=Romboutsia maritimum TaxID=2020948 RepID=A0A371IS13_9FIRM|nr:class I SAM-dependent methyltransferase [Romboutsia maritimum]RDY23271.1 class I SAM-dependent methyltransferase [Romboutsia maritimum]